MKILIVEDDVDSRIYLERVLRGNGFEVDSAENGRIALEKARTSPPELIVSDILMPEMDGFALCLQLKSDDRLRPIPFVFYTATYTSEKDKQLAYNIGAARFVIKPQPPEELLQMIYEVLSESDRQEQADSGGVLIAPNGVISQYNAALFRKLEKKVGELEEESGRRKQSEQVAQQEMEMARQLSQANQELERVSHLKDEFLANISHELRTPLTAVIGLAETLQAGAYGEITPEQTEVVASIEQSGRHLLELINDILDLAKMEAKQAQLEMTDCSLQEIAQASLQIIKPLAQKKHIQVELDIQPGSLRLQADSGRLKQMLINLLSNAVKFTPDGGKLGLTISKNATGDRVLMTVWDSGIGIHPEDIDKLFQPFVQIDNSLGRQYAGTGLGLALVQKSAQMHGGTVSVESEPGVGSRFTIAIPWRQGSADPKETSQVTADRQEPEAIPARLAGSNPTNNEYPLVLLAEDNPQNVMLIRGALRHKPWRVLVAGNGIQAMEMTIQHHPDLVLMDIQMPLLDGLSATRQLRQHPDPVVAATPIIALTAQNMKGDRESCLAAGVDDFIAKPIDLSQMQEKMKNLARKHPLSQPS